MGQHSAAIAAPARRTRMYAERLMVGVTPAIAARKPVFTKGGDTITIDANHPVFVLGHLALYPAQILGLIDRSDLSPSIAVPAAWEEKFKNGAPCQDDPSGTIYPAFSEICAAYFKATDAMLDAVESMDDAILLTPTAHEGYAKIFPVTGPTLIFMLNNHTMMHLGQVSTWRRCMGLPPA